jgi:LmbE family N-acetylglucosaminyl deacetylase
MLKRLLVISSHPDDETLGAGGTLLRYKKEGSAVFWLNITDMKAEYGYPQDKVISRSEEIKAVKNAYGFEELINLGLRPAGLDQYPLNDIIEKIAMTISNLKPDTLIIPYQHDPHSDHQIVFRASFAAAKSFRQSSLKRVMMMQVQSDSDFTVYNEGFLANVYVDISEYIANKLDILSIYKSELGEHPFPRSMTAVKAQAALNGVQANCEAAEAFILLKEIL